MSIPSEIASLFLNNEKEMDAKQKIVEALLDEKNLDRKTELDKPIRWSCLSVIENVISNKNLPKSAEVLKKFIDFTFRYMISNKRKGRDEYVRALQSLNNSVIEQQKPIDHLMK